MFETINHVNIYTKILRLLESEISSKESGHPSYHTV